LESGSGIAEHPDGTIYVAGNTTSLDLPGAQLGYDSSFDDSQSSVFSDAYVARLSGDGTQILSATYLGGPRKDGAGAPAVDAMGRVIVCGSTLSSSFPTTPGAVQPGLLGLGDGFIAALSADLSSLLASTYWGASGDFGTDFTVDLVSDGSGVSTIVGETTGTSFVTTAGAFMAAPPSIWTGYITRLSPGLDIVLHSTVVGGLADFGPEYFSGVASLPSGRVAAVGQTYKPDFPVTPNALQPTLAGLNDVTVSVLELQPTGVSAYGFSTPSCLGEITVGADRLPSAGSTDFHLYCSAAPPSAIGFLGLGAGQVASGLPLLGITVFLDPALPLFLQPVVSDQQGFLFHPLPLPAGTSGQTFYAQFAWIDAPGCVTPQGLSASFALAVTIQ
jgi:hypothetical protein